MITITKRINLLTGHLFVDNNLMLSINEGDERKKVRGHLQPIITTNKKYTIYTTWPGNNTGYKEKVMKEGEGPETCNIDVKDVTFSEEKLTLMTCKN